MCVCVCVCVFVCKLMLWCMWVHYGCVYDLWACAHVGTTYMYVCIWCEGYVYVQVCVCVSVKSYKMSLTVLL